MSHRQLEDAPLPDRPPVGKARTALIKRLADVVCLPSSRVNAFERAMTADVLVEMLREAAPAERKRVARRLTALAEAPPRLLRLLLRDEIEVARPLLEEDTLLADTDLIDCATQAGPEHRALIARRRHVSEVVCEALISASEPQVVEILLANDGASLSADALDALVAASRDYNQFIPLLLRRAELRPAHAYVLFWWSTPECRRLILTRFAVSREVLQEAAGDVFAMAATEEWQDPLVRKALQFIERRQRNRAALARSSYTSLDEAIAEAGTGMTRELVRELSFLAGIKPTTGAKIFTDPYGEPLAILCKATGLPRSAVLTLWRGLRRPEQDSTGAVPAALERTLVIFDMMAVDRAQTVLRYWNWSLSSALTPALVRAIREGDETGLDEYSEPQRTAMLALSGDFGR
ncbi:MAG: DUF2336 domain-containing protein [Caulobacteraceae bacterium]